MLEAITLKAKNSFNVQGSLAESLLFYQSTNLILDEGSLKEIIQYCGYDNLIELSRSNQLNLKFTNQSSGSGNIEGNEFLVSTFTNKSRNKDRVLKEITEEIFGRNIASQQKLSNLKINIDEHNLDQSQIDFSRSELDNRENIKDAIFIQSEGQITKDAIKLEIEEIGHGKYNIESNIDKNILINATLLINSSVTDIIDAEINNSGLITNYRTSNYSQKKLDAIINRTLAEQNQIGEFHKEVLTGFYDLNGTISSGTKNFNDFMLLWRNAQNFKNWLDEEGDQNEILQAYIRKISEDSWLEKAIPKNIRWLIFLGVGYQFGDLSGGAAGFGLSVFDEYILGRLFNNWKPDQFVKGPYKNFLAHKMDHI